MFVELTDPDFKNINSSKKNKINYVSEFCPNSKEKNDEIKKIEYEFRDQCKTTYSNKENFNHNACINNNFNKSKINIKKK